jgi:hypothetical protein
MKSTSYDPADTIADGLAAFAVATNDRSEVEDGMLAYQMVAREIREVMRPGDTCRLALPSAIITADRRVFCFVAVLQDRVVIVWKRGMLRKTAGVIVIPISSITDVRPEGTSGPSVVGPSMLTIHGDPSATIALPIRTAKSAAEAIRRALAGPS